MNMTRKTGKACINYLIDTVQRWTKLTFHLRQRNWFIFKIRNHIFLVCQNSHDTPIRPVKIKQSKFWRWPANPRKVLRYGFGYLYKSRAMDHRKNGQCIRIMNDYLIEMGGEGFSQVYQACNLRTTCISLMFMFGFSIHEVCSLSG